MDFSFGQQQDHSRSVTIQARNLEHAIKIFKATELFPEKYVDEMYLKRDKDGYIKREHDDVVNRYQYEFKVANPKISIYDSKDKRVGTIGLQECINVDFRELTPQRALLGAPESTPEEEDVEETTLPVIDSAKALAQTSDKRILREKHDLILRKKAELEQMTNELNKSLRVLQNELQQKQKIIYVLETYLGLHEEVHQLLEGKASSEDEPLTLFQQKLFMDEEVGLWEDGKGLDFRKIDEFDVWICKHYAEFLYAPKSVCVFQVCRRKREYGDPFVDMTFNNENMKTYFLIRSGENLYRIWSDVITGDRLFPAQDEYQKHFEKERKWSDKSAREKVQYKHEVYLYGLIAVQGLIERTDIFGATLRQYVNLTKRGPIPEQWVKLVRDGEREFWLTDGRPSWDEFLKCNRETITVGSRVILATSEYYFKMHRDNKNGDDLWRCYPYLPGEAPSRQTIYIVDEEKGESTQYAYSDRGDFKIFYLPETKIYVRDRGERYKTEESFRKRKNRVPFWLYKDEVVNFDVITVEDCDYYMRNRLEREHYLEMLPTLHWIKEMKKKEHALEEEFTKFIAGKLGWDTSQYEKIRKAVQWWKLKNKWKRALTTKESTAVSMILKRLG